MWNFTNTSLPTNVNLNYGQYGGIISYEPASTFLTKDFVLNFADQNLTLALPTTADTVLFDGTSIYSVPLSSTLNVKDINTLTVGSTVLTPATSITDIQAGQFYYDNLANKVVIADKNNSFINSNQFVVNIGYLQKVIVSDYIDPALIPDFFRQLPLTGTMSYTLGFESQPSGSFNLSVFTDELDKFKAAFIPASELNLFGVGFRVNSYAEKPNPESPDFHREYDVSISLGSKWDNYISRTVYLQNYHIIGPYESLENYKTPLQQSQEFLARQRLTIIPIGYVSVNDLAAKAGAQVNVNLNKVRVPRDTPFDATANWNSLLNERTRIANTFVDYSRADAIYCPYLYSGKTWTLSSDEFLAFGGTSLNAIKYQPNYVPPLNYYNTTFSHANLPSVPITPTIPGAIVDEKTDYYPYGENYRNVRLTGDFELKVAGKPAVRTTSTIISASGGKLPAILPYTAGDPYNETSFQSAVNQPPYWRRKPTVRKQLIQGDLNPTQPPIGTLENLYPRNQYHLSLNFDSSGPTKTITETDYEDGSPIKEIRKTYGFAFTAADIGAMNIDTGELITPPKALNEFWQLVKYETTSYLYDQNTGYALGQDVEGWSLSRFKQESDGAPETLTLPITIRELKDDYSKGVADGTITAEDTVVYTEELNEHTNEIKAFFFRPLKSKSATRYLLRSFSSVYNDIGQQGSPYEQYNITLPDGSQGTRYAANPNYVAPMFVISETTQNVTFAYMPNPALARLKRENDENNVGRTDEGLPALEFMPPPPYVTGEETYFQRSLVIIPKSGLATGDSSQATSLLGSFTTSDSDLYFEYISEFNSLDANFKSSLTNTRFTEHEGRPAEASKRNIVYEKVDPSTTMLKVVIPYSSEYKMLLSTPGFENYPEGASLSYSGAVNILQAITAAQADLYVKNVLNTLSTTITIAFNPNFKPFDYVTFVADGIRYRRRVINVSHSLQFQGLDQNGNPLVIGATSLTLGLDRNIQMTVFQRVIPNPNVSTNVIVPQNPLQPPAGAYALGEILPKTISSRLNLRTGMSPT